jgi:hypothetical protein
MKFLFDELIVEEIHKKEIIIENRINASKEKSAFKSNNSEEKKQKSNAKLKVNDLAEKNKKIDSFFQKH